MMSSSMAGWNHENANWKEKDCLVCFNKFVPKGGSYTYDSIQIVCRGLNSWRADTPLEDFIEICRKVAENHPKKESEIEDGRT